MSVLDCVTFAAGFIVAAVVAITVGTIVNIFVSGNVGLVTGLITFFVIARATVHIVDTASAMRKWLDRQEK